MLSALAERGIRRPRRILIGALATFVVAAVLGGPVAGQLDSANGFEDPGSSSVAARQAIQKASGLDGSPGLIAVVDTPGRRGERNGARARHGGRARPRWRSGGGRREHARRRVRRTRPRRGGRDVGAGHRDPEGVG